MPTPTSSADHDLAAELAAVLRVILADYRLLNGRLIAEVAQADAALDAFDKSRA